MAQGKKKTKAKKSPVKKAKAQPKSKKAPVKKVKGKSAPVKKVAAKKTPTKSASFKWEDFFTPLDDRLLVEPQKFESRTASGLYLPSGSGEKPQQGTVLVVGRGHRSKKGKLRPMDVKSGDQILFGPYTGLNISINGQELMVLREEEVLGVIG